jgi:hypothetical protein
VITGPDFDIVILKMPVCEMNRVAIIPADRFFEVDALAVFRGLA